MGSIIFRIVFFPIFILIGIPALICSFFFALILPPRKPCVEREIIEDIGQQRPDFARPLCELSPTQKYHRIRWWYSQQSFAPSSPKLRHWPRGEGENKWHGH